MTKFAYETIVWTLSLASLIQANASPEPDLSTRQNARPLLGSVPYGAVITTCSTPGTVALTFDDGPGPYTSQLLDTLASNGIKATFFLLGNRDGLGSVDTRYPDIVKRMYREGHQIGSHTWDHKSLESLSSTDRIAEMTKNEAAFKNILGFYPTYMRPPYGFCYAASGCLSDMGKLGYHVIDWNVDTKDYENDSPTLIQNAKNNWDGAFLKASTSSSFIPLTHDIHQNTVNTLAPYMIAEIKQRGFKFATVGQCLGDPSSNWYRDGTTGQALANKAIAQSSASVNSSTVPATLSVSTSVSSARTTTIGSTTGSTTGISTGSSAASSTGVSTGSPTGSSARTTTTSSSAALTITTPSATPSPTTVTTKSVGVQLTVDLMMYVFIALIYTLVNA